jgi:hypothetical protein
MIKKKTLDVMKKSYVGMPYSLQVANQIESCGFAFKVSCATGAIADVFEPGFKGH